VKLADFLFVLLSEFAVRSTEATHNVLKVFTCWLMLQCHFVLLWWPTCLVLKCMYFC